MQSRQPAASHAAAALVENASEAMLLLDAEGRVEYLNPAARALLGMSADKAHRRTIGELVAPLEGDENALREGLAKGEPVRLGHAVAKTSAGQRRPVRISAAPIRGAGGLSGWAVVLTEVAGSDFHERAAVERAMRVAYEDLERRVAERTQELQRMNADLEGFTYSVSHDLRAPLRAIMGFARVLVEDFGREVDSEMRAHLDRIFSTANRMSRIIEDLLTFSRLGRKEMSRQRVDLSAIAEQVAADLVRRHPDRDTHIEVEPGLTAEGDPTLLRMAIENLMDNAYKFTSRRSDGVVEFRRTGEHTFVVRDNGAGFEPQYAQKLFRPFERLHSSSEYPGTGIGLANVRRIVERHGGHVWAEGAPEQGASFYFELWGLEI